MKAEGIQYTVLYLDQTKNLRLFEAFNLYLFISRLPQITPHRQERLQYTTQGHSETSPLLQMTLVNLTYVPVTLYQ